MVILGSLSSRLEILLKLTATILLLIPISNLEARRNTCSLRRRAEFQSRTAKFIRSRGFLAEDHYVRINGGEHVLNLVRATNPLLGSDHSNWFNRADEEQLPAKDPILFIHGILSGANCFVIANGNRCGPKDYTGLSVNSTSDNEELEKLLKDDGCAKSLAYTALNFGHEVWLLNRRTSSDTVSAKLARGDPRLYDSLTDDTDILDDDDDDDYNDDDDDDDVEGQQHYYHRDYYGGFDDDDDVDDNYKDDLTEREAVKLIRNYKLFGQQKYWNFSLDQQAEHDIPETIDYVLEKTKREKLAIVGYSAGGALTLMSLTIKPELADKISNALLWAPALDLGSTSMPAIIKKVMTILSAISNTMAPFPSPLIVAGINLDVSIRCTISEWIASKFCYPLMDPLVGKGSDQLMVDKLTAFNGVFQTSSWSEVLQLIQSIKNGTMHYYNFMNTELNKKVYGQPEPPQYDISKIKLENMHIFAGNTDRMVNYQDIDTTEKRLSVPVKRHDIGGSGIFFNHYAFMLHKEIVKLLIVPSLKILGSPS